MKLEAKQVKTVQQQAIAPPTATDLAQARAKKQQKARRAAAMQPKTKPATTGCGGCKRRMGGK